MCARKRNEKGSAKKISSKKLLCMSWLALLVHSIKFLTVTPKKAMCDDNILNILNISKYSNYVPVLVHNFNDSVF